MRKRISTTLAVGVVTAVLVTVGSPNTEARASASSVGTVKNITIRPVPKYANYGIVRWTAVPHADRYAVGIWPVGHRKRERYFAASALPKPARAIFPSDLPAGSSHGFLIEVTAWNGVHHGRAGVVHLSGSNISRSLTTHSESAADKFIDRCVRSEGIALGGAGFTKVVLGIVAAFGGPENPVGDGVAAIAGSATAVYTCVIGGLGG